MSQHLKKGCPLTIEMIAKKRAQFTREARLLFRGDHFCGGIHHVDLRNIVAARTILYMNKFRYHETLDEYVVENENSQ